MKKTNKPRIANWLRRLFLLNTLLPSLLIAVGLLLAAWLGNRWLYEQHQHTLREVTLEQLQQTVHDRSQLIAGQLVRISRDVASFARHTALALEQPSRSRLDQYKQFARTPDGALHSNGENGGFAFFYSGITPVGPGEIEKLQRLLRVDPAMAGLVHRNPPAVEVFFTSHDSLHLSYPYQDLLSRLDPGTDLTTRARYREADATRNSDGEPKWISAPLRSQAGAWQATCVAPVLREDRLEGVAGMTIAINTLLEPFLGSGLAPGNQWVLLAEDGTRLGTWPHAEQQAKAAPQADEDLRLMAASEGGDRSVKLPHPEPGRDLQPLSQVLEQDSGADTIGWNGGQLGAWATIPQTGWKLLALAPDTLNSALTAETQATVRQTILTSGLGLMLFLPLAFWLTVRRSRRAATRLTAPLQEIATMARQTGEGKYLHQLPQNWFEEQDHAGEALQQLGQKLQGDLQDQTRTEIALRRSGEALEQRLSTLSSELKLETRKRERLEKAPAPVAGYDAVTGLPNPRLFVDRAHQALALAKRHRETITLVLIELYELAPRTGSEPAHSLDELHREVALRLQACLRDCDTIARLSQDEFVILLFDHEAASDPESTAQRIIERIGSSREETDQGAAICGSIGISHFPEDGEHVEELLHQADNDLVQRRETDRHCFRVRIAGTED